jgi:RNA-binding protein 25
LLTFLCIFQIVRTQKQDEEKEKRDKEREQRRELDRNRDDRDRKRDGERERMPFRERERDRRERKSRSPAGRERNGRRVERERFERETRKVRDEVEDESAFERRRIERELRKKEQSYQERLKNWEIREIRKQKEREKERTKQEQRQKTEAKEVVRLKQFVEDYNDDVDDSKYYKGSSLQRKLKEREKEKEDDERDCLEEKRELDELRQKLVDEGIEVTNAPEHAMDIAVSAVTSATLLPVEKVTTAPEFGNGHFDLPQDDNDADLQEEGFDALPDSRKEDEFHVKAFTLTKNAVVGSSSGGGNNVAPETCADSVTPLSDGPSSNQAAKKVKTSLQEVFNTADDDDSETFAKRRRLPLFDNNTDSNHSSQSNAAKSNSLSAEDKRKQIKALIDSIPTSKEQLFKYVIDWSIVDTVSLSTIFVFSFLNTICLT